MSQQEQIQRMRLEILGDIADSSKDEVFKMKLVDAEVVALNTLYPYDLTKTEIEQNDKRLKNWQIRCAIELYKASERIGVQAYSENGLSVQYLTSLISSNLLNELVPKAGVPK